MEEVTKTIEEQESVVTPEEKKPVDITELIFERLIQFQAERAAARESCEKGARLIRIPSDSLYIESVEQLREELTKINEKKSRLSASQRAVLVGLRNAVIWEMIKAQQEESSKGAEVVENADEE